LEFTTSVVQTDRKNVEPLVTQLIEHCDKMTNLRIFKSTISFMCEFTANPLAILARNTHIREITLSNRWFRPIHDISQENDPLVKEKLQKKASFSLSESNLEKLRIFGEDTLHYHGILGKILFSSVAGNKKLKSLIVEPYTLGANPSECLEPDTVESFNDLLEDSALEVLEFSKQKQFTGIDLNLLRGNQFLKTLRLPEMPLNLQGVVHWKNCYLIHLDLSSCGLKTVDIQISSFPQYLEDLNLSSNLLTQTEKLFVDLHVHLPNLHTLDVHWNQFSNLKPVVDYILSTNTLKKFHFFKGSDYPRKWNKIFLETQAFEKNTSIIDCDFSLVQCPELHRMRQFFERNKSYGGRKTKSIAV